MNWAYLHVLKWCNLDIIHIYILMFEYMIFNEYHWKPDGHYESCFKDNEYTRQKFLLFSHCVSQNEEIINFY